MKPRDLLYETWISLAANKGRSFLTILGIVIGISAVIAMTSLVGGIQNSLMGELGFAQARQVMISAYTSMGELDSEDLEELEKKLPDYDFITGYYITNNPVSTSRSSSNEIMTYCVTPDFFVANGTKIAEGRLFTQGEELQGARYAVIDKMAIPALFGDQDAQALGELIKIGNDDYKVIGVVESDSMRSFGGTIYVPRTTAEQRLSIAGGGLQVLGFLKENVDIDAAVEVTTTTIARHMGVSPEEVYVFSFNTIIKQLETTMAAFSLLMGSVASISLFVGGIGIMNMMLTNVTERIREIGLRKSLGARRRDVTLQFLFESIALCVVGGIVGIFFGLLAALGLGALVGVATPGLTVVPAVSLPILIGALLTCVFIGIIFGYYPARRAAKLDPVESLRYQ